MILTGVLFLAARTTRSQAYAQAMLRAGLYPEKVLLFGLDNSNKPGQSKADFSSVGIDNFFVPDFSVSLKETIAQFNCPVVEVETDSVNDDSVYNETIKHNPKLVIYSGYGGQIVGEKILGLGAPFLHIHSGWLPDFRGSTTLYYSLLKEGDCGVSAILMSPVIDMGYIVKRKKYPAPSKDIDIDHVYDSVLRSDLLVEVLREWKRVGKFNDVMKQEMNNGTEYYVIHPLLKHLAIMSLKK